VRCQHFGRAAAHAQALPARTPFSMSFECSAGRACLAVETRRVAGQFRLAETAAHDIQEYTPHEDHTSPVELSSG
jgi:hypothetical protein